MSMNTKRTTVINVRNFPVDVHRGVKSSAALEGVTIQEWFTRAAKERLEREQSAK